MIKYMLSLVLVSIFAVSAQATNGYGYGYNYVYPQRVVTVEKIVTPHVTVRKEFVEVPGLQYVTDYHNGVVVEEIRVERQRVNKNRDVVVQRVVVDRHNRDRVVERVVIRDNHGNERVVERVVDRRGNVVKVQRVVVRRQQQRRGFFRR
jgi:hypothetical protein